MNPGITLWLLLSFFFLATVGCCAQEPLRFPFQPYNIDYRASRMLPTFDRYQYNYAPKGNNIVRKIRYSKTDIPTIISIDSNGMITRYSFFSKDENTMFTHHFYYRKNGSSYIVYENYIRTGPGRVTAYLCESYFNGNKLIDSMYIIHYMGDSIPDISSLRTHSAKGVKFRCAYDSGSRLLYTLRESDGGTDTCEKRRYYSFSPSYKTDYAIAFTNVINNYRRENMEYVKNGTAEGLTIRPILSHDLYSITRKNNIERMISIDHSEVTTTKARWGKNKYQRIKSKGKGFFPKYILKY